MRPKWLNVLVWPRKFAHSSFSSLVHSLLPKDNLFKNIFPIHIDTVSIGLTIVHHKGSQVIFSKLFFLSLKIVLILANSADPDEMWHYALFHLGLHC